jgi:hypothetical protein
MNFGKKITGEIYKEDGMMSLVALLVHAMLGHRGLLLLIVLQHLLLLRLMLASWEILM